MKIVIIGAGFGGLKLARLLSKKKDAEVLLIDRFNHHQFQPLFYQLATAGLDASNISFPIRKVFQSYNNITIRIAEVLKIHDTIKCVETSIGNFGYDMLVIATGADTNFFNNADIATHAYPMKSSAEALQIRHSLLHNFEQALMATDAAERQANLNIAVVGGGPTGVELCGALAEMRKYNLPKDYPELNFSNMHIYLVEGSSRLLNSMSEKSSNDAYRYLQEMNVDILLNTHVENYDGKLLSLKDKPPIASTFVIWAAGIRGNVPAGINPELIARGNRIQVNQYNQVLEHPNIFAIGDVAYMTADANYPNGHPQVAPVAIQQAQTFFKNIEALYKNEPQKLKAFAYHDKGSMATVGRKKAVVDIPKPKMHINGLLAWLIWNFLHLMLILGVKNRFSIFTNWMYNYFTKNPNLRLIFKEFNKRNA